PPNNVSVSISPSGEIVEDSSVTLTCSSDANPPVEIYTWFKVNESSAVGSGQSYRALQSGQYYCQAQNKHGSDRSAAVSVTLNGSWSVFVYAGVGVVVFVCVCLIVIFFYLRKKKGTRDQEEDIYSNIAETNPINRPPDTASPNQSETVYASVSRNTAESPAVKASASEVDQHASVRYNRANADY
ncbi:B-cell receptor CD22-like, partial [Clarias magur]